jgi:hypothetical protein
MADRAWIRGENGLILQMDLPLPDAFATRLARGEITRVNEDGTPWEEEPTGLSAADDDQAAIEALVIELEEMRADRNIALNRLEETRAELGVVMAERDNLIVETEAATKPVSTRAAAKSKRTHEE